MASGSVVLREVISARLRKGTRDIKIFYQQYYFNLTKHYFQNAITVANIIYYYDTYSLSQ